MKVVNPATGALLRDVPADGPNLVRAKYERARAAQPGWAALPIGKRLGIVRKFRERVVEKHESLARTLTQEMGASCPSIRRMTGPNLMRRAGLASE